MDLLHLVDRLEELIAGAQKMPIGNRAIVDRRRMLDLIDQMRVAIPEEVREAQEIVANREEIRREAEEDGRIIVARAEERAARLVEQHEITQAAHQRAEEIAIEAEQRLEQRLDEVNRDIQERIQESRRIARQQMSGADDYAREMLQRLEGQLLTFVNAVQNGIRELDPVPEEEPDPAAAAMAANPAARYDFTPYDPPAPQPAGAPIEEEWGEPQTQQQWGQSPQWDEPEQSQGMVGASDPQAMGFGAAADRAPDPEGWGIRPGVADDRDEPRELENLLERPEVREVIDDFANEPLDDDPLLFPGATEGDASEDEERR